MIVKAEKNNRNGHIGEFVMCLAARKITGNRSLLPTEDDLAVFLHLHRDKKAPFVLILLKLEVIVFLCSRCDMTHMVSTHFGSPSDERR